MTDRNDPATWYDVLNPWGPSDDACLELVLAADRVLDVGCGTGTLLRAARDRGHGGTLVGLDPDPVMLGRARALGGAADIEWVLGDAASVSRHREFDLVTMASHVVQFLADDTVLRRSLAAIHASLADGGRLVFDSWHPQTRPWAGWDGASFEATNSDGDVVLVSYEVAELAPDVVRVAETLAGPWWDGGSHTDVAAMRFVAPDEFDAVLADAGFAVEERFGDWTRGALTPASDEFVTIARRT